MLWIWVGRESRLWKFIVINYDFSCWTLWYRFLDMWKTTPISYMYYTSTKLFKLIETCFCLLYVILHCFFHRIRKWRQHMWNFTALGDSMFWNWGVIENRYVYHRLHAQEVASSLEPNISFEFVPIPTPQPSIVTHPHPCPPMNKNITPMPTQNPWAWVDMGMGTQCRAMLFTHANYLGSKSYYKNLSLYYQTCPYETTVKSN